MLQFLCCVSVLPSFHLFHRTVCKIFFVCLAKSVPMWSYRCANKFQRSNKSFPEFRLLSAIFPWLFLRGDIALPTGAIFANFLRVWVQQLSIHCSISGACTCAYCPVYRGRGLHTFFCLAPPLKPFHFRKTQISQTGFLVLRRKNAQKKEVCQPWGPPSQLQVPTSCGRPGSQPRLQHSADRCMARIQKTCLNMSDAICENKTPVLAVLCPQKT